MPLSTFVPCLRVRLGRGCCRRRSRQHPRRGGYLAQRVRFGIKFGLETMRALVAEMGHPERAYPTLLIAGTNGKGSVAAYCDDGAARVGAQDRALHVAAPRAGQRAHHGRRAGDHRCRLRARRARGEGRRGAPRGAARAARPSDLLRDTHGRGLRALPPRARRRGRARGGPRRAARRHERRGARRLGDRQRRPRPRDLPRPHAREDRARESRRAAGRACDGRGPAGSRRAARRPRPGAGPRRPRRGGAARRTPGSLAWREPRRARGFRSPHAGRTATAAWCRCRAPTSATTCWSRSDCSRKPAARGSRPGSSA